MDEAGQCACDACTVVTVCSACLQASCWQGIFYCDAYKSAGTVERTIEQLKVLNLGVCPVGRRHRGHDG